MPEGIAILIMLAWLLLVFWISWGLRGRPGTVIVPDPVTRYRWTRAVLVFYGIVGPPTTVWSVLDHQHSFFQAASSVTSFILISGVLLFQFLQVRKKFLALPEARRRAPRLGGPQFLWQAIFILLPVTVMAAFGFWAILHQRRMVEQDAQARAADIIHALPNDLGQFVADALTPYDAYTMGWLSFMEEGVAAWPGSKLRSQVLDNTNEIQIIANAQSLLREAFPDWKSGVPPIANFILDTRGQPALQQLLPPNPPEWLLAMTANQRAAWSALLSADFAQETASNLDTLAHALKQTGPPSGANTCAEFIVLRSRLRSTPATNAVERLLKFAGRNYDSESESGLPLRSLALAEALRRSSECGATEKLWEALRVEACQAGALASPLLDQAARLVAVNAELSNSVEAMKICLAERGLQRELAGTLAQAGYVPGTPTTNLWINAMGRRWFCLIQPNEMRSGTSVSGRPIWTTNFMPEVRCYPKSVVIRGFTNALDRAKVSLPDYLAMSCELEGEPLVLPAPWNHSANSGVPGDVLAEMHSSMNQPAIRLNHPGDRPSDGTPFEAMPGHPRFTLQIHLADRHLLYARQRQLQLIFGSLITLSLLSAVVGFTAARRAFQRQLQLNEQKSNFVSSVSHELRAPIASVRLMAENLERGKISGPDKQGEYFRFIVQECRRLSSLIENVLDFSRIEQGRKQYEFEPTNVVALVETTVKIMEPYAAEKGVALKMETLNIQPSTFNFELNLDGRAIQQALVNLIDNAVKHSPKGETVTIGMECAQAPSAAPHPRLALWVQDHGPGIPAAEHEKIFERFYRLGSELRRETQGVGIGLSVVKHIVEAHGGRVRVESKVGQGSRFTIELPQK
jgi:signal transduction histidine kinase